MKKTKIVKKKIDAIEYFECPHCKKLIIGGTPELTGYLKRWAKQNNKK